MAKFIVPHGRYFNLKLASIGTDNLQMNWRFNKCAELRMGTPGELRCFDGQHAKGFDGIHWLMSNETKLTGRASAPQDAAEAVRLNAWLGL